MSSLTFEQLVDAAIRLQPELRTALVQLLQIAPLPHPADPPGLPTEDDDSLEELEALREAGAFEVAAPLTDAHSHSHLVAEADLLAAVQSMATGWEDDPLL